MKQIETSSCLHQGNIQKRSMSCNTTTSSKFKLEEESVKATSCSSSSLSPLLVAIITALVTALITGNGLPEKS